MIGRWLQARRERRQQVEQDARDLLTFLGDQGNSAYDLARTRARERRAKGDRVGDRHWSRVAVEIARRTGHVIGQSTADRFLEENSRPPRDRRRRAMVAELVEIAQAIGDLSRGTTDATTLHNAEAAVHRLVELAGPAADEAGRDLRRALAELAAAEAENAVALQAGRYPERADAAGKALWRLRHVVLPAAS